MAKSWILEILVNNFSQLEKIISKFQSNYISSKKIGSKFFRAVSKTDSSITIANKQAQSAATEPEKNTLLM